MSWLVVAGVALLSVLLWLGERRSSRRAEVFWIAAWCSTIASGALLLFAAPPVAEPIVAWLGPVFPAGQLAGALAINRRDVAAWIVPLALALGLVRAAATAGGFASLVAWIPLGVEPAAVLTAAVLLHRASRLRGAPPALALLPPILVIASAVDLLSGASGVVTGELSGPAIVLWAALVVVGMPLQVHLAVNRDRDQLANRQFRTEAELEESQARFRALCESTFDLVAEIDGDERFTYVNPRYEEVLGYPREEMLGRCPIEFVHPDDVDLGRRFADEAETETVAQGTFRARRSDGGYLWLENVACSFLAPNGVRRWVMNSRDVSDRVERDQIRDRDRARLARSAVESEERFRALTEQAPELISEFDDHGRYTFANESFRELLGIDPKTLIGTGPGQLIHPDDFPTSRAGMVDALRNLGTTRALHRLRHADGSWRWFENTGRAYRTATGELRFVSIGRDVTEARRRERERRELEHRMREVQRLDSLGVLAGGIAHDFNNLLAVILGNVDLLEGADPGGESRARLQRIRSAATHAERLTDQMLTYAGKSVGELVPTDLSGLVAETEDLLRATLSDRDRLDLELAEGLPAVHGDATQLRQVLLNLVANAVEAQADGRHGSVRVRTALRELDASDLADGFGAASRPPGTWVELEVADEGPGMSADVRGRIFDPFFTTKASGRGLGLSAVLGIASAHGGVLQVDSKPGAGTSFRLLLRPSGEPARAPTARKDAHGVSGDGARVLVVDDDDAVREVAQLLLERAGFSVWTAAGGAEALARLEQSPRIDAVVLDLEMPSLSGAELLERLRRNRPDLPVVIASGYKRDLASDRLGPNDDLGFVQKPYDPDALVHALEEALRRSASRPGSGTPGSSAPD